MNTKLYKTIKRALLPIIFTSLLSSGCGKKTNDDVNDNVNVNTGTSNVKTILTSIYPMYCAAMNVVDGASGIRLANIAPPHAGCAHDYQLTPADAAMIERASALIINGGGLETFLGKAASLNKNITVVDAGAGIEFLPAGAGHDHGGYKKNKDAKDGEVNSHVWMSVGNHIAQIENIAGQLSAWDTANAGVYNDNARRYIERLTELAEYGRQELSRAANRKVVIAHDGLVYLARELDLTVVAVIEKTHGVEPSAAEWVHTISAIKKHSPKALISEGTSSANAEKHIASKTKLPVYGLDMITSDSFGKDAYIKAMERNIAVLKEALR